jgi:hypothetical protein
MENAILNVIQMHRTLALRQFVCSDLLSSIKMGFSRVVKSASGRSGSFDWMDVFGPLSLHGWDGSCLIVPIVTVRPVVNGR